MAMTTDRPPHRREETRAFSPVNSKLPARVIILHQAQLNARAASTGTAHCSAPVVVVFANEIKPVADKLIRNLFDEFGLDLR